MRHRAIRHHAQGVEWCEQVFGRKIYLHHSNGAPVLYKNSEGVWEEKWIPVKWVAEQHVKEDMGVVPTMADWLREMPMEPRWMAARALKGEKIAGIGSPK